MSNEKLTIIPARRTFFGLLPAAGKLGIIEDGDQAIGLLVGGERLYFRNVETMEQGTWQPEMETFIVKLTSDVGKHYVINFGSYLNASDVPEMFTRMQEEWRICREQSPP